MRKRAIGWVSAVGPDGVEVSVDDTLALLCPWPLVKPNWRSRLKPGLLVWLAAGRVRGARWDRRNIRRLNRKAWKLAARLGWD